MRAVLASFAVLWATGCSHDDTCNPNEQECTIEQDVSTVDVAAGAEDEDTCQSWTLNNPTELWVNSITQKNDGAYHHANWFFVPDNVLPLPDGTWSCSQNMFTELTAALLGGYLFALSTQSLEESQALPPGSAIRIPPYSRIIGSSHFLNGTDVTITTTMHLAIHTIPPPKVLAKMAPSRISYHDLSLDAAKRSSFTQDCILDAAHMKNVGTPLQYELHFALFHYHSLGMYAELRVVGGPRDGEILAHHDGYGENDGVALDPPVDLGAIGAKGIRFTCGFQNPRDKVVHWGIGDQEMCVVALQARTGLAFDGDVPQGQGHMVGVAANGEVQYAGDCGLLAFPWDFEKSGGPPR
jgi:hypothetical protein